MDSNSFADACRFHCILEHRLCASGSILLGKLTFKQMFRGLIHFQIILVQLNQRLREIDIPILFTSDELSTLGSVLVGLGLMTVSKISDRE